MNLFLSKPDYLKVESFKDDSLKNPFNYTGSKFRMIQTLVNKLPYCPESLNVLDCFGGSGDFINNIPAKSKTYNELNPFHFNFVKYVKNAESVQQVLNEVEKMNNHYHIDSQDEYMVLVNDFNGNDEFNKEKAIQYFLLIRHSFSNMFRVNKKGKFNINRYGKRKYNDIAKIQLRNFAERIQNNDVTILNENFKDLDFNNYDFVYMDPPYLLTDTGYNKNWTEEEEKELYRKTTEYMNNGGLIMISNQLESKGKENTILKEWIDSDPRLIMYSLGVDYSKCNYHRKPGTTMEILITNY